MDDFLSRMFWGNSVKDWLIALAIIVGSFIILRIIRTIVMHRLRKWAQQTANTFDDLVIELIERSVMPMMYGIAVYAGLTYLDLPQKATNIMHVAIMAVVVFFVIRLITTVISYFVRNFDRSEQNEDFKKKHSRGLIIIVNIVVWMLGIVFLVDNMGYDISTVVAGLGIGGIAVALAAQTILGDLFSYFVIYFDKPFEIGDFIIVDSFMGAVEYIGIKTTRIRALSGEQLVFSNTDLTNSRLHNYKRMERRRIVFSVGVTYDTPIEKLKKIPGIIRGIIEATKDVQIDRVHFQAFGDFSLNYECVYYILSADFNMYMDRQQEINFAIAEAFEKEGIEFAFPTQTIMLQRTESAAAGSAVRETSP